MTAAYAAHHPGDPDERERHHDGGAHGRIDVEPRAVRAFERQMGEAGHVVGDGGDR